MKHFLTALLLASVLLLTGCADPYYEKLEDLEYRVAELQKTCDQINSDLLALQSLVSAIEKKDMITGVTELRSGTTLLGYRINFVDHAAVTISNGKDGNKPLVASQRDPEDGNWYWTVQYGDGTAEWLLAPDGSKMLSIGVLPYVTIRDGWFCYTLDGINWVQLGKADGENGDQMFKTIDTRNDNYVIFTLTTGAQFKIPTYRAYLSLKSEFEKINENADAQADLLSAQLDTLLYITRVSPILSSGDTIGQEVVLSDGKRFRINDWTSSVSPAIFIKKDTDGKFYWAYTIGNSPEQWVLSPDGSKISASSESVQVPQVSVTRDRDGQFYWTVTTGGNVEFLRYQVDGNWEPRVVDSTARAFSSVKNYSDSLVVVLKDNTTRFVLPKQYAVTLTDAGGHAVNGSLSLAAGQEAVLNYTAYGPSATLTLMVQGGFTATAETVSAGQGRIRIKAPASIPSGGGKVMAFFSFSAKDVPVTVIKTITIS